MDKVTPYTLSQIEAWLEEACLSSDDVAPGDDKAKAAIRKVVLENWDVFNVPGRVLGCMVGILHNMTVEEGAAVYQHPYLLTFE